MHRKRNIYRSLGTGFLISLAISASSQGQYYKPYSATTKRLFSQYPVALNGYSLSFDSATVSGDQTQITSASQMDAIEFINVYGQLVVYAEPRSTELDVSLISVEAGHYSVRIVFNDGSIVHRKLIVTR